MNPKKSQLSRILNENFIFRAHFSTFRAENTTQSRPFKAETNTYTLPEKLLNLFEKVQKTIFLTRKKAKTQVNVNRAKSVNFLAHFGLRALKLPCWCKHLLNIFPLNNERHLIIMKKNNFTPLIF